MNLQQIEFIRSLDKTETSGTVTNILLGNIGTLHELHFETVLQYLLVQFKNERDVYELENAKMRKVLVDNGLYTSELMGLE